MSTVEQPIINTIECPEELRFKGYPEKRLHIPNINYLDPNITLPDGTWQTNNVSDRPGEVVLPTPEEIEKFTDFGLEIDDLGRPLHPNLKEMIGNSAIGVVTGKGFFRNWGPNYTADLVVVTKEKRPRMLMIERSDGGGWAFAGGFIDANETSLEAGVREVGEEAGETIENTVRQAFKNGELPELIHSGPVPGEYRRTTAHAWTSTDAHLIRIDEPVEVVAGYDAKDAAWPYVDSRPNDTHPGHERIALKLDKILAKSRG